jgi:hypothetical protein
MRRTDAVILITAMVGLMVLGTAGLASAAKVVVEAESYYTIQPSMAKAASQVASGGAYIHIPLRRPHGTTEGAPSDTGHTTYRITIPEAGSYTFWGRAHWYDGCGNSFFLRIGDKPNVVFGNNGTYQRWHWVRGPRVTLNKGTVTIRIQNREDGAKLDQFLLTTNARYVPVQAEKETSQYVTKQ